MGVVTIVPILTGAAATGVAALQLAAWIAAGSLVLPRRAPSALDAGLALVIGASFTGALLAVLTAAAMVPAALLSLAVFDAAALIAGAPKLVPLVRSLGEAYAAATRGRRAVRWSARGMLALLWLDAIAPPT